MNRTRAGAVGLTIAMATAGPGVLYAQEGLEPLMPVPAEGKAASPFFEGWYKNADGSYTLSFGYFNRNRDEVIEVPIGPDNMIEPAEFDGMQPTYFPPVRYGGYTGRRERGVFAVTIPASMAEQDVVWTIRSNGETHRVPGRVTSTAYELSTGSMAMGSLPPAVMVDPNGAVGAGPEGIAARDAFRIAVDEPLALTVWGKDVSERESGPVELGVTWWKHQGPGEVTFSEERGTIAPGTDGASSTLATFSEPGDYMVRVRVDNHRAPDSSPADQCCWSNGYFRVTVTP